LAAEMLERRGPCFLFAHGHEYGCIHFASLPHL
jgi:hypothetical protein